MVGYGDREVRAEQVWPKLKKILLNVIHLEQISRNDWQDAFDDVYKVGPGSRCPTNESAAIIQNMKEITGNSVVEIMQRLIKTGDASLLENYSKNWEDWKFVSSCADILFRGLTVMQLQSCPINSIKEEFINVWREKIFSVLQKDLFRILYETIDSDRKGETVAPPHVHNVLDSFVELEQYRVKTGMGNGSKPFSAQENHLESYQKVFETPYLISVGDFYRKRLNDLQQTLDCAEFMQKVVTMLDDENKRSRKFIHSSSFQKVAELCRTVMIDEKIEFLLSNLDNFLKNQCYNDVANMYVLLSPSKVFDSFLEQVEKYWKNVALNLVKSLNPSESLTKLAVKFVEDLHDFHKLYSDLVKNKCNSDNKLISALDRACFAAINHKNNGEVCSNAPRYLAIYIDINLKKSSKMMQDDELDQKVNIAMIIFGYIDDKDVFQRYYCKLLANRLVYGLSSSMDAESQLISKQKHICGLDFVRKAEQMFTDIRLSEDFNKKFGEFLDKSRSKVSNKAFQITICQSGSWPFTPDVGSNSTFLLPEFHPFVDSCLSFYSNKQQGRKLQWLNHLSRVELSTNYLPVKYTISMTFHQACLLLLYNSRDSLIMSEVVEYLKIEKDVVEKNLKLFVDNRFLTKINNENETSESYVLNHWYKNVKVRFSFNAPPPTKVQTEQEKEKVVSSVEGDRKYELECKIVQIMKTRKVMKHVDLMTEVINQTKSRFVAAPSLIKKTIESLITREFLARSETKKDEYTYLP